MVDDPYGDTRTIGGRFGRGNPGGPGRPKGPLFMKVLDASSQEPPTPLHYKMASRGTGLEEDEIPVFETVQQLRAWTLEMAALGGNDQARNALLDRVSPKPSRSVVDVNIGAQRKTSGIAGDSTEAEDYMRELEGGSDE